MKYKIQKCYAEKSTTIFAKNKLNQIPEQPGIKLLNVRIIEFKAKQKNCSCYFECFISFILKVQILKPCLYSSVITRQQKIVKQNKEQQ